MKIDLFDSALARELILKTKREEVAPKFEAWRLPMTFKAACGGRGAGAKSTSVSKLLCQKLNYTPRCKWFCGRQYQNSLEESSFSLIWETIEELQYGNWEKIPTRSTIKNNENGSYFYFGGFNDIKAAKSKKSFSKYSGCWVDEAEDIPMDVWTTIIPTFVREKGSEMWVTFNRNKEIDPAYELFFLKPYPNTLSIELLPGKEDNPWFPEALQAQLEYDYKTRPDIAAHIWGGKPKSQADNAVMSRVDIRAAMRRNIEPVGAIEVGCDVARFGGDLTEMYKRHGQKIIDHKTLRQRDTQFVAKEVWRFAGMDREVKIKIDDTGLGGGVTDRLRELGATVIPVNFAENAREKNKYDGIITEMWFEFDPKTADLPDDNDLADQLVTRLYDYDNTGRTRVEPKEAFRKRYGKSPDKADALLLTYYTGKNIMFSNDIRAQMAARRAAGR